MTFTDVMSKGLRSDSISSTSTQQQQQQQIERQESVDQQNQNIWSFILQEVQNSTKKSPPPKSIIVLGDNESGRSTLISRLKGVENISKGIGLEYHYIDIKDDDRDDTPKLGVWIPDGDGACTGLLKFALNETNFENTSIVFVVSMSTPWTIMDSLKKWSGILSEHVKKLNLAESKRSEYLRQQVRAFQLYQDPDEQQQVIMNSSGKKANLNASGQVKPSGKIEMESKFSQADDDDSLLPLDPSILNKNLGIPITVVLTKSDSISLLDKENEYRIEHFDFIQYHIRKFCLDYGAALFYTTVKDKRTYDKLYKYLIHKLYSYPFTIPASVVDRESILIPSGWDNEGKINILLENSTTIKSDSEYTEIISRPSIRKPMQRDVETVVSHEDQDFLSRLQIVLNKTSTSMAKPEDMSGNQSMNSGSTTPQTIKTPLKPPAQALKGTNPTQPDSTNLKNFFQNLLNKNAPTNTSSSSLTSIMQSTPNPVSSDQNASPQSGPASASVTPLSQNPNETDDSKKN